MTVHLHRPITYLVTSGRTTPQTTPNSPQFLTLLRLIEAAVNAEVSLIQLREKTMSTRVLEQLAKAAVKLTQDSQTQLLINERFDVALATGADGVQLTSQSVPTNVVRNVVGSGFLLGVSTHSLHEALQARNQGADFVLFGPVFQTESKREFGKPQGVASLKEVAEELKSFPVIAIGGVNEKNAMQCLEAGAAGVAAISLFADAPKLTSMVKLIRS